MTLILLVIKVIERRLKEIIQIQVIEKRKYTFNIFIT
jgi:hypothetical protein